MMMTAAVLVSGLLPGRARPDGGDGGEGPGVRRPRPTSQKGRVDGARPAPVSTGGLTSGAGLRFHTTSDCEGSLLHGGFRTVTDGLNGRFDVAFNAEVRVLGDLVEVGVCMNYDRVVLESGRRDYEIGQSDRYAFPPKREAQSGCSIP